MQLCHPGRQSPFGSGDHSFFAKTLAPSAVPLTLGSGLVARAAAALLFGTPKAMTKGEINMAIEQFVQGAKLAYDSGVLESSFLCPLFFPEMCITNFRACHNLLKRLKANTSQFKGVELHGAHGYLITQFLSSSTNLRTDEFGGTATKRAELVLRIIKRIRSSTSKEFCIGIKLNSVDASTETLADVLEQIGLIEDAGIDFMELSGGTYSSPEMMKEPESRPKGSTLKREAFFLEFAQTVREHFPKLTLMVTGGFRTRIGIESALNSGACDLIGIGRPGAVLPHLPKDIILNETVKDEDASVVLKPLVLPMWINWTPITAVGAGYQSYYYASQIQRMGKGLQPIDTRA